MKPITIKFTFTPGEVKSCIVKEHSGYAQVQGGAEGMIEGAVNSFRGRLHELGKSKTSYHLNQFFNGREGRAMIVGLLTEAVAEALNPPKKSKTAKKAA